jgi:hypothetical protein
MSIVEKKVRKSSKAKKEAVANTNIQYTLDSTPVESPCPSPCPILLEKIVNSPSIENEIIVHNITPIENRQIIEDMELDTSSSPIADVKLHKKRGRKPKGGKLITKSTEQTSKPQTISNIVLHLKCSFSDIEETTKSILAPDPLKYNPVVPPEIMSADCFSSNILRASLVDDAKESKKFAYAHESLLPTLNDEDTAIETIDISNNITSFHQRNVSCVENHTVDKTSTKEINAKLKRLKINLYKNECSDKRAACFWCTYDFDSPPCYIPKYEMDQTIYGYGSFCRPECAAAYLMKENIDDSSKFERYYLLNQIYGKIFGYEKNIKLAPNPYYLLDKYYGNLTIQEYRKLLKMDHMLIVLEKPMTRVLPELHEDNDMVNINTNVVNTNGNYKVKRQSEKQSGPSKTSIIRDCFNL